MTSIAPLPLPKGQLLYQEMGLDQDVEDCDQALRPPRRKINWILWFCVGFAIVLLIAWLRK